jgi:phosphoenolpyruvate synthase/pyruvate phosphate dikinase
LKEQAMSVSPVARIRSQLEPVRTFAQLGRGDAAYAGGKGANLGELTAAGVPVTEGFVIGAPAYAAYCEQTGLRAKLAELLHPEHAELLVRAGIDAISVNIDVIDRTRALVAAAERRVLLDSARNGL